MSDTFPRWFQRQMQETGIDKMKAEAVRRISEIYRMAAEVGIPKAEIDRLLAEERQRQAKMGETP